MNAACVARAVALATLFAPPDDIFEPGHEPRYGDKSDRSLTVKISRVMDVLG